MNVITKYEIEDLNKIIIQVIENNRRHADYNHVVKLQKKYFQYLTGKYQGDLIVQYKDRESDDQKKQRVKITQPRTPYYGSICMQPFEEIARAEDYQQDINSEAANKETVISEVSKAIDNFSDGMSLRRWMDNYFRHFIFYDPNAWLIVDFVNPTPKIKKPIVFPIVVNSVDALDFEFYLNNLQYLVIREDIFIKDEHNTNVNLPELIKVIDLLFDKSKLEKEDEPKIETPEGYTKGSRYILYAPNIAIEYVQTNKKSDENGRTSTKLEDENYYFVETYDTKSVITPAKRFGYLKDPETNLRTLVSPLHSASSLFDEAIQRKSELDLHLALHGFLRQYSYGKSCTNKTNDEGHCDGGRMSRTKSTCSVCKGVGKMLHTTVQDVMIVDLPSDMLEDGKIPALKDMVHYVQVPTELIELQRSILKDLEQDIIRAVFNTKMFESKIVQTTATEVIIDKIPINNVLKKAADQQAELMKLSATMIAIHQLNYDGFSCNFNYGGDFRLESIQQLLEQRQAAVNSGAPAAVIAKIDEKILSKQFQGDKSAILKAQNRAAHRPFRERSIQEKQFLLATIEDSNKLFVLEVFFEEIMDEIEVEVTSPPFYQLDFKKQKEIIAVKVENYKDQIKPQAAQLPANV